MKYDVDYFIKKFEAIPEEKWTTYNYVSYDDNETRCALGHCGMRSGIVDYFGESKSLNDLIWDHFERGVVDINDSNDKRYQQPTPKQRILAALYDIKKMQQPEVKPERTKTVYVSVPVSIIEQSKELIQS